MRRNSDNLLILAGNDNRRGRPAPILLGDAMRAAISEVEDYQRVRVGAVPPVTLTATAGRDLVHVLAELLDNSLHFSPPDSAVTTTHGWEDATDEEIVDPELTAYATSWPLAESSS